MVYISEAVIKQVLEAKSNEDVRRLIEDCLSRLQGGDGKGTIEKKYTGDK